ncbi:growth/differentiation factor 6-A-like [Dendronephthya gigantea]|uniref:growth/differentiation factor 6-A-like n=1 Tax=Dendronephthya gigantea TaxID=151771 RepID=UPI00106A7A82|nr:growth/differentiation factor 6-A-like [Dendronephthya gigantea]XP_028404931.1 growth/differentiation factor 6-A-like [Dendronephthya gigantea]XP_028404932.1 growth/differentiation factor 6-A-like [Dendronephthya gigantea]XP_028404933.1 growth/differentiation factor 6-A-like [Dendronephthya gigantea]
MNVLPRSWFVLSTRLALATILLLLLASSFAARKGPSNAKLMNSFNSVKNYDHVASEETARQMLNVLGIDELPKPRHGIVPHQYMIEIYEKMSRRKSSRNGVNTIRGFVDVGDDDSSRRMKFHQIYSFNISALPSSEKIISADLRLLRIPTGLEWKFAWAHGLKYHAKLYYKKTVKHIWNSQVFTHTQLVLVDTLVFDIRERSGDWKVLKVLDAMLAWRNDTNFVHNLELQVESVRTGYLMPAQAFGLMETGRTHDKRALLVSFTDDGKAPEMESKDRPQRDKIVVETDEENGTNRIKRNTKRRRRRKPICNRKKLYVDFILLGWSNWILAPRGYNAYYCQGMCKYPIAEHLKPTNHAMVQTTVHYSDRRRVPPACCVPNKLSGLGMLFLDKGDSVVYKVYNDMVVERCGCK